MKRGWSILLILIAATTIWLGTNFFIEMRAFLRLGASAPASLIEWSVQPIPSLMPELLRGDSYALSARCLFRVGDRGYEGTTLFASSPYPNPYAARREIEAQQMQKWSVWYDPADPSFSSLVKVFPAKTGLRAALALGVLLYFLGLRWMRRCYEQQS